MGNTTAIASERRSVQGWSSSKTEDFSRTTINSETFPCALGSNKNNLKFSVLHDYVTTTTTTTKEETFLLKVITKDHHEQYSVVGTSSSAATSPARWSKSFSDSGWEISGSLDKVGSKALLTTGKTTTSSGNNGQGNNNKVLAVVLKRDKSTYLLLSKQPAYKGQRMHLRIERGTMLFPWATCTTIDGGGGEMNNNNYEGSSAQQFQIKRFDDSGISYVVDVSSEIFGMRTVHIKDASTQKQYALARQQQQQQQQQIASSTTTTRRRRWDIVSGPFTSPGLVLCTLAIVGNKINGNDVGGSTSTSSTTQHQHLIVDQKASSHPSETEEEEEGPVEEEEAETTTTPESEDNLKEEEEASEIIPRKIDGSHDRDDETNFNSSAQSPLVMTEQVTEQITITDQPVSASSSPCDNKNDGFDDSNKEEEEQ